MTIYDAHGSGSCNLPVHLAANASTTIDMMVLTESQQPDVDGHTIRSAVKAGSAARLRWTRNSQGLVIELPAQKPCDYAFAVKITAVDPAPGPQE